MPSKNDISQFAKAKKPKILPSSQTGEGSKVSEKPVEKSTPKPKTNQPKRVGRKPKPKAEKRSFKIMLSLTEAEGATIAEKAGLADKATYVYDLLKKSGAFD